MEALSSASARVVVETKDEKKDAMLELIFASEQANDAGEDQFKLTRTVSEARVDRGRIYLMANPARNLHIPCTAASRTGVKDSGMLDPKDSNSK